MAKLKLQPREFRLRAGARTELDRNFLQIIKNLPESANLSEFIKISVVENYQRQNKLSEIELLEQETDEFLEKFRDLKMKLQFIEERVSDQEKLKELKANLRTLAKEVRDL